MEGVDCFGWESIVGVDLFGVFCSDGNDFLYNVWCGYYVFFICLIWNLVVRFIIVVYMKIVVVVFVLLSYIVVWLICR